MLSDPKSRCRSGCTDGPHESWGACLRAARLQFDEHSLKVSGNAEKDKDRRLTRYEEARHQGLQPKSTQWHHVRDAFENGGIAPTEVGPSIAPAAMTRSD